MRQVKIVCWFLILGITLFGFGDTWIPPLYAESDEECGQPSDGDEETTKEDDQTTEGNETVAQNAFEEELKALVPPVEEAVSEALPPEPTMESGLGPSFDGYPNAGNSPQITELEVKPTTPEEAAAGNQGRETALAERNFDPFKEPPPELSSEEEKRAFLNEYQKVWHEQHGLTEIARRAAQESAREDFASREGDYQPRQYPANFTEAQKQAYDAEYDRAHQRNFERTVETTSNGGELSPAERHAQNLPIYHETPRESQFQPANSVYGPNACVPTSISMAERNSQTPSVFNSPESKIGNLQTNGPVNGTFMDDAETWARNHGYPDATYQKGADVDSLKKSLQSGPVVIVRDNGDGSSHATTAIGVDPSGKIIFNDPGTGGEHVVSPEALSRDMLGKLILHPRGR